jgi:hypothetical protein
MLIGYAGPGWEWPSKADVFGRSDYAAKQSEVRRSHGKTVISAKRCVATGITFGDHSYAPLWGDHQSPALWVRILYLFSKKTLSILLGKKDTNFLIIISLC